MRPPILHELQTAKCALQCCMNYRLLKSASYAQACMFPCGSSKETVDDGVCLTR